MIAALLEQHRAAYRDALYIERLVSRQPPTTIDVNTGRLYSEDPSALGMTISGRLLRFLGHPDGYGSDFGWLKALWMVRVECRRSHPHHRAIDRPYWRGALCHQALRLTVVLGKSPDEAARILRLPSLDELLCGESGRGGAFRILEDAIDQQRARAERRAREDEGRGPGAVPQREPPCHHPECKGRPHYEAKPHPNNVEHREECPQCRRAA